MAYGSGNAYGQHRNRKRHPDQRNRRQAAQQQRIERDEDADIVAGGWVGGCVAVFLDVQCGGISEHDQGDERCGHDACFGGIHAEQLRLRPAARAGQRNQHIADDEVDAPDDGRGRHADEVVRFECMHPVSFYALRGQCKHKMHHARCMRELHGHRIAHSFF